MEAGTAGPPRLKIDNAVVACHCKSMKKVVIDLELVKKLYAEGKSQTQIAEQCLTSQTKIYNVLKDSGITRRTRSDACKNTWLKGRRKFNSPTGSEHWLWKGGKSQRGYRVKVKKEVCSECGSRLNLCVHHKDFDHFNNDVKNLQVLCVSCHLSFHKKEFWKAKKAGLVPKTSTAPSHWR